MTRRVLVARLDSVGDVVLTGPAVRAIAAGRDSAATEVWMLCGPQGSAAARLLPAVHRVITWDCPWISDPATAATRDHVERLIQTVSECSPDEAVILTSFHQSPLPLALLLRLAGVPRITAASVDFPGSLLDVRLRPGEDLTENQPEAERAVAIAAAAGFALPPGDDGRLRVLAPPAPTALTGADPYLVVHPGAQVPARTWPVGHYRETVRLLAARGHRVLVTGGDAERELASSVAGSHARDLAGRTSLAQLAGVIAGAEAVITGNTGPAHLAAAVGTPVVSLFSPVVPAVRWAPYRVETELLGDQQAPCRNTRARVCPVPGHPCLTGVTPAETMRALARLLGRVRGEGAA